MSQNFQKTSSRDGHFDFQDGQCPIGHPYVWSFRFHSTHIITTEAIETQLSLLTFYHPLLLLGLVTWFCKTSGQPGVSVRDVCKECPLLRPRRPLSAQPAGRRALELLLRPGRAIHARFLRTGISILKYRDFLYFCQASILHVVSRGQVSEGARMEDPKKAASIYEFTAKTIQGEEVGQDWIMVEVVVDSTTG